MEEERRRFMKTGKVQHSRLFSVPVRQLIIIRDAVLERSAVSISCRCVLIDQAGNLARNLAVD